MRNRFKIYIVGFIPSIITLSTIKKFEVAKEQLRKYPAEIINPIDELCSQESSRIDGHKRNLNSLVSSNAIYVLNENGIDLRSLPELKIALSLNLIVMHQAIDLASV